MKPVIQVEDLHKHYKEVKAVDGISFEVYEGTIFGIVGPNGAGKTTTIECVEGLRKPDSGVIRVLDLDPLKDRYALQKEIGIELQESGIYPRIKVKEALELFSTFYPHPAPWQELLERFKLDAQANVYYEKLSGGQKKRLHIILALIGGPRLLFLDEITTGLDPQARHSMWDLVKEIRGEGKTVFLTTHYMEEAQELCDVLCIIDHGKAIALDKPDALIRNLNAESKIILTPQEPFDMKLIQHLPHVSQVKKVDDRIVIYGKGLEFLVTVTNAIQRQGLSLQSLQAKPPTLEDVYLALTGREYRD
jgi:ABC-2 type transport system ATP-binding protein